MAASSVALQHEDSRQPGPGDPQRVSRPLHRPERARGVEPGVVPGLEGRGAVHPPGVAVPLGPVARPVHVAALHRVVDGELVLVLRAVEVEQADDLPDRPGVVVGGQRGGQARPQRVVVAALQERVVVLVRADQRTGRAVDRVRLEPGAHPVPGPPRLGRGRAELIHAVALSQPGEERVHPALEGIVLVDVVGVPDAGRVDRAVQDHAADPAGEQRRVHLADVGAVRVREVADLLLAQGGPDGIHVPGHVLGGHVRQQPAEPLLAVRRVGLRAVLHGLLGGLAGRDVVGPHPAEEPGVAVQRGRARPDAARVEADDVIVRGHRGIQALGHLRSQAEPAGAGPAGVDEQHSLALGGRGGGRDPGQRKRDLAAVRVPVIQRHPQPGALHPGHLRGAGVPAQAGAGPRPARGPRLPPGRPRWPASRLTIRTALQLAAVSAIAAPTAAAVIANRRDQGGRS